MAKLPTVEDKLELFGLMVKVVNDVVPEEDKGQLKYNKFEDDLGVAELEAGTAIREEFISDDGRELVVWKSKDGTPFQYFSKGDEWNKEKMIRIFKYNSEKDAEHIEDLKKELNKSLKKVDAIELSCAF